MTAKPVAKIEPFAPIICINTELQINFIKKPAAKLIKANRCSLTPCKMAAVTVYNANNNATGEYQASKFPVKSKLAITQQSPRRMIDELPALDLHVLGTPPAFVLSQDQTLHKICKALSFKISSDEVGKTCLPTSNK